MQLRTKPELLAPAGSFMSGYYAFEAGADAVVGSSGGRMTTTMDRYEADWPMVERGYYVHVHGKGRQFPSLRTAVETLRDEEPGIGDQNLPSFVIAKDGEPVGRIHDGDGVVFFNFRGDRAIEISRAFEEDDFSEFKRGDRPEVFYCGMMEYDGDLIAHYKIYMDVNPLYAE